MKSILYFFMRRAFLLSWVLLVIYLFYRTFIYYQNGLQFEKLRTILGLGLCISRSTAAVLNLCCALVLLPLCKKVNQLVYRVLSRTWPGLFFFWLQKAKSFHITVAVTLIFFAVIHSISHFVNLWSFSRNYDDGLREINVANYKNENPFLLLLNQPGLSGMMMLVICIAMGVTSSRVIRRAHYNAFWYTHQLYLPFYVMLLVHPLSGVLKEEILEPQFIIDEKSNESTVYLPNTKLVAVKSTTWLWMAFPLCCFSIDYLWRLFSRNRAKFEIIECTHMDGRTIRLVISCPSDFQCRIGQYVLLQCPDISAIEWHPFSLVQIPSSSKSYFSVWIRVNGDWTSSLEQKLLENGLNNLIMLVDGPYCSAMESTISSNICICVAAGVGITPFVAILQAMLDYPCSRLPGRVHLIWIVRRENEILWIADLVTETIHRLRFANKPDRLNLEIYITETNRNIDNTQSKVKNLIVVNGKSNKYHMIAQDRFTLLTPKMERNNVFKDTGYKSLNLNLAERYPIIGCRLKSGRPNWDHVFRNCVQLYPGRIQQICKMTSWSTDAMLSPGENYFAFNLMYLNVTGSWSKSGYTKLQSYAYSVYVICLNVLPFILVVITCIGTYNLFDDKIQFFINLDRTLLGCSIPVRLYTLLFKNNNMKDLVSEIMFSGDKISSHCVRFSLILPVISTIGLIIMIFTFTVMSFWEGEMPISAWMPFDPMQSKLNLFIADVALVALFTPTALRTTAQQFFVCSLLMYFGEQLEELNWRLKNLEYNSNFGKEFRNEFREILTKHIRLIRYSKKMNNIYSTYFFMHNLGITMEVCTHAVVISMIGFQDKKWLITQVTLLLMTLLNTFIQFYYGNEMIVKSRGISLSIYEANWTKWPLDSQKDLLFVIAAAQKELKLNAGGFSDISLRTFAQIIYNGYSVFTVLHDMF